MVWRVALPHLMAGLVVTQVARPMRLKDVPVVVQEGHLMMVG